MQLQPDLVGRLTMRSAWNMCGFAAAVLVAVILARILWVMSYSALMRDAERALAARTHRGGGGRRPCRRGVMVSWCGMRGIVTLAAAFALPE